MIFMVLVGGLGTFEGPIIGALVLFLIQNQFSDSGVWYLVGLGATAVAFALFLPQGVWGFCEQALRSAADAGRLPPAPPTHADEGAS